MADRDQQKDDVIINEPSQASLALISKRHLLTTWTTFGGSITAIIGSCAVLIAALALTRIISLSGMANKPILMMAMTALGGACVIAGLLIAFLGSSKVRSTFAKQLAKQRGSDHSDLSNLDEYGEIIPPSLADAYAKRGDTLMKVLCSTEALVQIQKHPLNGDYSSNEQVPSAVLQNSQSFKMVVLADHGHSSDQGIDGFNPRNVMGGGLVDVV